MDVRTPIISLMLLAALGCDRAPKDVVVHEPWSSTGPAVTEYLLPCASMPQDVRDGLPEWLQSFVGQHPLDARQLLVKRWQDVSEPSLRDLANLLTFEFTPKSIAVTKDGAWLIVDRPDRQRPEERDDMLIPPPPDPSRIEKGIARFPIADQSIMREFLTSFGAMQDVWPGRSGLFLIPDEWSSLRDYWGDEDDHLYGAWYPDWKPALIVCNSPGGDMVLLHPDGRVAYHYFAEGTIQILNENLTDFFARYVRHRRVESMIDGIGSTP
ncbi:MAG: hypothetical protein IT428_32780 [Planctomycetaceae bacterium]|nr:hypothetical protein [Planctomycetaceae bacterium]